MKVKNIFSAVGLCLAMSFTSCDKFLNVTPQDNLSGNNYWQSTDDYEKYLNGIYATFRTATMSNMFFPATGDFRCAPIRDNVGRGYLGELRNNNLKAYLSRDGSYFGFQAPTRWKPFFEMVQASNILIDQVDNDDKFLLSDADKQRYKAEAVFLRNLAYFFMVRLYGDVPYYVEAYNSTPLPRTNMLEVLDKCIADLLQVKDNLPWTFDDPSIVAVRPMRGSALILLMHMNMWRAGFTTDDPTAYYNETVRLGKELIEQNGGAYELFPLERTKEIFKGRTKEGLFEIMQNLNYGERFSIVSQFSDYVLHKPLKPSTEKAYISYESKFMEKVYPEDAVDNRKTVWFDEDIYKTDGSAQILKFTNVFANENEDENPDDNQVVFRFADAYLLTAEALAELNQYEEALTYVNVIRERAGAPIFTSRSASLRTEIFYERIREMMGEGHYFYDLVRTKKIMNPDLSLVQMGVEDFYNGAWTWPIDEAAMVDNPYMVLNNFWR
jgi:hypothetical protein